MTRIDVDTRQRKYAIYIGRGILQDAAALIAEAGDERADRRNFVITDSGVPQRWIDMITAQIGEPDVYVFSQGEASKNMTTYGDILSWLADKRASRADRIIAVGGGVTGDMAGFAAATYMRGIEYINIPTTSLSQIDSGIGGKTAIDHNGVKNLVGAFHQPSLVIVDPDTLSTLDNRELANGLAEAVKTGLIGDRELFEIFESNEYMDRIEEIIERSLSVKKKIVEADENESSLRKILNFGHTIGHAYESYFDGRYLHGECVAMGMMKMTDDEEIRARLESVLQRLELPTEPDEKDMDVDAIISLIMNDKKAGRDAVDIIRVREIGKAVIERADAEEIRRIIG